MTDIEASYTRLQENRTKFINKLKLAHNDLELGIGTIDEARQLIKEAIKALEGSAMVADELIDAYLENKRDRRCG